MSKHGTFIAIEGGDGSGKATQAEFLAKRLMEQGRSVYKVSFPRYGMPSAKIVELYLNGAFGEAPNVPAELVSLAYAIDRFDAAKTIRENLDNGAVVIADRYVASNLAHQGTKFTNKQARHDFYSLILQQEYEILGIPKPDINIVLSLPATTSQKNVDKKKARTYTSKKRDVHEADLNHLELAKQNYIELCKLYPAEFTKIDCMANNLQRPVDDIHEQIWSLVKKLI